MRVILNLMMNMIIIIILIITVTFRVPSIPNFKFPTLLHIPHPHPHSSLSPPFLSFPFSSLSHLITLPISPPHIPSKYIHIYIHTIHQSEAIVQPSSILTISYSNSSCPVISCLVHSHFFLFSYKQNTLR